MTKDKKSWYNRWWAIVLYVIIGLIILGSLMSEEKTVSTSGKSEESFPKETLEGDIPKNSIEIKTKTEASSSEEPKKEVTEEKLGILKQLEETKEALDDYKEKTDKLNGCTKLCAGDDYDIPYIKNEWYNTCYQLYYYGGMEALERQITECKK